MPLPPALLARLQKRGIIQEKQQPVQLSATQDGEEVFAEDYDDPNEVTRSDVPADTAAPTLEPRPAPVEESEEVEEPVEAVLIHEVTACPNKSNPYHECVDYCRLRWGMKAFEPDNKMLRRRTRMLEKYPPPSGWHEVADPQTSRYYYWNSQTDEVSWLSPVHPRATVTKSAEKTQEKAKKPEIQLDEEGMETAVSTDESGDEHSSEEEPSDEERRRQKSRALRDRSRDKRGRKKDDEPDPMDPSSYSEVARGTWSSGLDLRGSAKTGVDHTVSGPLFQQRPYPSPGDILRANRQNAPDDK